MPRKLSVDSLYKIFGRNVDQAIDRAKQGQSKDQIFEETGAIVAVNNVTFGVQDGEIFVVMGLSGSGKSTLVRCINRLIEPTSGTIEIDGEDVGSADAEQLRRIRRDKTAMVFQHFALFPHMTVAENAEYGLKVRGIDPRKRRQQALEALDMVGLAAWADAYPDNLSGGMKQRVGLARGLAVDPEILLMDEPFSALDPLIRREMQDELLALQKRLGTTIVFITHDLHEALKLGTHVAIMKDGRFVQIGSPQDVVNAPANDYVRAFTRDVDRGRVLTVGSIAKPAKPLVQGRDTPETAAKRLANGEARVVYVTNREGRPLGLITRQDLDGDKAPKDLDAAMRRDFPQADEGSVLADIYGECRDDTPLAVVDGSGRMTGIIDPREILSQLSQDDIAEEDAGGGPAAAGAHPRMAAKPSVEA